jgi:hypothetical protein
MAGWTCVDRELIIWDGTIEAVNNLKARKIIFGQGLNIDSGTLYVDSVNHNVGIGTTTPNYLMHMHSGTVGSSVLQLTDVGTGVTTGDGLFLYLDSHSNAYLKNKENTDFYIGTDNSTDMTIKTGGNVGIGTTVPRNTLTIVDNVSTDSQVGIRRNSITTGDTALLGFVVSTNTGDVYNAAVGVERDEGGAGDFIIKLATSGGFSNLVERMRIDRSTGNVGIGTTSPSAHLEVSGTGNQFIRATTTNANDVGFTATESGTTQFSLFSDTSDSKLRLANYRAEPIEFSTDRGGTENVAMTILDNGNVGIGTTSPDAKLHLADGDLLFSGAGSGLPYGCIAGDDETVTCTNEDQWYQVTFDALGCYNLTTPSTDDNDITIIKAGVYQLSAQVSFHSAVAHDFEFKLSRNNGTEDVPHAHTYQTTAQANRIESTSINIICTMDVDDTLELWVQCTDAAGQDVILDHVNICCTMIGG